MKKLVLGLNILIIIVLIVLVVLISHTHHGHPFLGGLAYAIAALGIIGISIASRKKKLPGIVWVTTLVAILAIAKFIFITCILLHK